MKCKYCGICLSRTVCEIHEGRCPDRYKEEIEEANSITLETSNKRDLMVYILSESEGYTENQLKKLNKQPLLELAQEIRNGG